MALFAQPSTTDPITLRAHAVGERLMCQCGCPYTVSGCNMTGCHFRDRIGPDIEQELRAGLSIDAVIEKMIAKYGEALRTAPQAEGFGLVGWAMPFFTLLVGLAIVPFVVRKWKRSHAAAVEARAPIDPAAIRRYEEEIEKDLAKFD